MAHELNSILRHQNWLRQALLHSKNCPLQLLGVPAEARRPRNCQQLLPLMPNCLLAPLLPRAQLENCLPHLLLN